MNPSNPIACSSQDPQVQVLTAMLLVEKQQHNITKTQLSTCQAEKQQVKQENAELLAMLRQMNVACRELIAERDELREDFQEQHEKDIEAKDQKIQELKRKLMTASRQ
ncbi:hypothetical protein CRE_01297 [Caenorhabditis remanei]|uniref:Uncharacterized protein n=1 Tax=Caenorhabditis remanei TaxID=31234 RepID=E3N9T5_CAERE|nr:hypothetical protein CRE_01297 [Caenorhabditis remanei]